MANPSDEVASMVCMQDVPFVVVARTAVPALVAEVRRLRAAMHDARRLLEPSAGYFYESEKPMEPAGTGLPRRRARPGPRGLARRARLRPARPGAAPEEP